VKRCRGPFSSVLLLLRPARLAEGRFQVQPFGRPQHAIPPGSAIQRVIHLAANRPSDSSSHVTKQYRPGEQTSIIGPRHRFTIVHEWRLPCRHRILQDLSALRHSLQSFCGKGVIAWLAALAKSERITSWHPENQYRCRQIYLNMDQGRPPRPECGWALFRYAFRFYAM
jgi:hypothetical protein